MMHPDQTTPFPPRANYHQSSGKHVGRSNMQWSLRYWTTSGIMQSSHMSMGAAKRALISSSWKCQNQKPCAALFHHFHCRNSKNKTKAHVHKHALLVVLFTHHLKHNLCWLLPASWALRILGWQGCIHPSNITNDANEAHWSKHPNTLHAEGHIHCAMPPSKHDQSIQYMFVCSSVAFVGQWSAQYHQRPFSDSPTQHRHFQSWLCHHLWVGFSGPWILYVCYRWQSA